MKRILVETKRLWTGTLQISQSEIGHCFKRADLHFKEIKTTICLKSRIQSFNVNQRPSYLEEPRNPILGLLCRNPGSRTKSYLSGLPRLRINVWACFDGFFLALFGSAERSRINVLNIYACPTPKCWNEPKRRGGETEPTEKLNQRKICISHFVLLSAERSFQFSKCRNIGVGHYGKWEKWP